MKNKISKSLIVLGALVSVGIASLSLAPLAGAITKEECKCGTTGQVAGAECAALCAVPPEATAATCKCGETDQIMSVTCGSICSKSVDQPDSLFGTGGIFVTITNTALFLIGAISVVMLIYGGIRYTVSGGESGAVTNAKNTILYAIVGIIVALLAFAAVQFVTGRLVK